MSKSFRAVETAIEGGEGVEIGSAKLRSILAIEARKPLLGISAISDLAEFAVVDDVDAVVDLFAHDVFDRLPEAGAERVLVVILFAVARSQEGHELRRAWQAADVGYQYAVLAAHRHLALTPPVR